MRGATAPCATKYLPLRSGRFHYAVKQIRARCHCRCRFPQVLPAKLSRVISDQERFFTSITTSRCHAQVTPSALHFIYYRLQSRATASGAAMAICGARRRSLTFALVGPGRRDCRHEATRRLPPAGRSGRRLSLLRRSSMLLTRRVKYARHARKH